MRSTQSKFTNSNLLRVFFFVLLSITILLITINGLPLLALSIAIAALAIHYLFSIWVTRIFLPELTLAQTLSIIKKSAPWRSTKDLMVIRIADGRFDDKQVLYKRQRSGLILHIVQNSLVAINRQNTGYQLLHSGIYSIPEPASICAVFSTAPQIVIFGPESHASLSDKKSREGMADHHVRINKAQKTATITSDGGVIYPKFEAFYRLDIEHQQDEILKLVNRNADPGKPNTAIMSMKNIEELIFSLVIKEWKSLSENKSASQITAELPVKLSSAGFKQKGLTCQVFVREIFRIGAGTVIS